MDHNFWFQQGSWRAELVGRRKESVEAEAELVDQPKEWEGVEAEWEGREEWEGVECSRWKSCESSKQWKD